MNRYDAMAQLQRQVATVIDRLDVALQFSEVGTPIVAQTIHALRFALGGGTDEEPFDIELDEALALVSALLPYVLAAHRRSTSA